MNILKDTRTILVISVLFVFINSLPNDFIFDDTILVENSLNVMNTGFWDLIFSYRPLRYITYALDYRIFGMNPWGFRLMNIVYHALTVLSLFWMLKIFGLSKRAAFVASLVFAIHPVHTDSVSYISGRRDVVMGLFSVQSVGWFMKFYNSIGVKDFPHLKDVRKVRSMILPLLLSLFFLFLSISSKEMGATIPLIFILYIFYKDGAKLLKKQWFYVVMLLLLILFSFFVFFAISSGGSGLVSLKGVNYHGNSPEVHYLTATTIWFHYLKLTLFPLVLILDNANYPLVSEWNFKVFFSILSMFAYIWIIWRMATIPRKTEEEKSFTTAIAFWMVFFVISLGPVLQIIPLHEIVAIHYLYIPVIAFCVIAGVLYDHFAGAYAKDQALKSRIIHYFPTVILLLLLSFFSIRTLKRNFELKDLWTVFHADEKWEPLSFRGYFSLGALYVEMGFPNKALEYYRKAEQTGSWDGNLLANILGYHILKGDHDAALENYKKMKGRGEYITSQGILNISVLYLLEGKCSEAIKLATSFSPLKSQLHRISLVKECPKYGFDKLKTDDVQDIYHKQELMKEIGLEVERKPYLKKLIDSGELVDEELIDLVHELAVVNLQSDVPEAIKYYKMERALYREYNKSVPEIVDKSIRILEDYRHKVIIEGKYYKMAY